MIISLANVMPDYLTIKMFHKKGKEIRKFAKKGSSHKAGDLIGSNFVIYQASYFGFSNTAVANFEIPGLHGHHLTLNVKSLQGVNVDL